jgi:hypothetical protein
MPWFIPAARAEGNPAAANRLNSQTGLRTAAIVRQNLWITADRY